MTKENDCHVVYGFPHDHEFFQENIRTMKSQEDRRILDIAFGPKERAS
jgi:hypothetical protein